MSELVLAEGTMSLQDMAAELGGSSVTSGVKIPTLKINYDGENSSGVQLPLGAFYLNYGAGTESERVYAKDGVNIRPLSNHIQYQHWSDGKLLNKSILVNNTRQEARDQLGGIACGIPSFEIQRDFTKEQREEFNGRDKYRIIRALITYTGTKADGTEVVIENQPCVLSLKRKNFGPFYHDVVKALPPKTDAFNYNCVLSAEKQKTAKGATYYIIRFEPQISSPMDMDQMTYDSLLAVIQIVKAENARIEESYGKAAYGRSSTDQEGRIMSTINALDDDYADAS
jgi:hypothetical protein